MTAPLTIVCGGGAIGSMGALTDGVLETGGKVIGVLPLFMKELEWERPRLTQLKVVENLHTRKREMLDRTDAAIALPSGSGTLEELMEAITRNRLGLYLTPIVLVNIYGYFDPLLDMARLAIDERFMDQRHGSMCCVAQTVAHVIPAIQACPTWSSGTRPFAALH